VDLEAIEVQLQKENQVLFKEKNEHLDVQKEVLINQQVVHLMMLKQKDQEKVNYFKCQK
jgi:hypothetical protein